MLSFSSAPSPSPFITWRAALQLYFPPVHYEKWHSVRGYKPLLATIALLRKCKNGNWAHCLSFPLFLWSFLWFNQQMGNRLQRKEMARMFAKLSFRTSLLVGFILKLWRLNARKNSFTWAVIKTPLSLFSHSFSQCVFVCTCVWVRICAHTPTLRSITQPCDSFSGWRH